MKIRKILLITMVLVIGLFFISTFVQAVPVVSLELSTTDVIVGNDFAINVIADGVDIIDPVFGDGDLLAFGFDIDFDAFEFDFLGATVAPPFNDDSLSFPDTDVAGSTFPGIGGDDILLATLSFTPLLAGDFSIGIISDLTDWNEGLITFFNESINITQSIGVKVSPVPEPATILLLTTGVLGMGVFRRKKFKK